MKPAPSKTRRPLPAPSAPGADALALLQDPETAGQLINQAARRTTFADYSARKAANTRRRDQGDLACFAQFLLESGLRHATQENTPDDPGAVGDLVNDPAAWAHITFGIIQAFRDWMMRQEYAISTVNMRLGTVKKFARLAIQAGAIPPAEWIYIQGVHGYTPAEQPRIDELRIKNRLETRRTERRYGRGGSQKMIPATKKAESVIIAPDQATLLKNFPDNTPIGRRDNLLMAILLDHGLREGEVALLRLENINREERVFTFNRPKVNKVQTHRFSEDSWRALQRLLESGDLPRKGALVRRVEKNGKLGLRTLTAGGIAFRVGELGNMVGIEGLSPHDCRHFWATLAARSGTDLLALQEAGGWNSLEMPRRYIEAQVVANEGVKLDRARKFQAEAGLLVEIDDDPFDPAQARQDFGLPNDTPEDVVYSLWSGAHPLQAWREYRKLSRKTLSVLAGVSAYTIGQIEHGQRSPSAQICASLAAALDLSPALLWPAVPAKPEGG
jgi:integrase/DNA-binding XRE family transcriptional regulator